MKTRNWRSMKMGKQAQFHWEMRLVWLSLMKLLQVHAIMSPSCSISCHEACDVSAEVLFSKHHATIPGKAIPLVTYPIPMHCLSFCIWECSRFPIATICQLVQSSCHPFTITIAVQGPISLLRSRSGRSHVTLPVPTRLLQTDIHSFLGVLRFCLLGPMSLLFSCHCIRCTNHRREHSQENESHTLIGLFPRKEYMSVWSSCVGTGSVTWLRPEPLRRRLGTNVCHCTSIYYDRQSLAPLLPTSQKL